MTENGANPTNSGTNSAEPDKEVVDNREGNVTGTRERSLASDTLPRSGGIVANNGVTCKKRNYAEIISEAKDNRSLQNTLYVTVQKLSEKRNNLQTNKLTNKESEYRCPCYRHTDVMPGGADQFGNGHRITYRTR